MSWRTGATLFREIWPIIQKHLDYDDEFRADFVRELLSFFMNCDMDGAHLRRFHPEIDRALDELEASES